MSQRGLFLLAGLAAVAACGRLGALKTERFACSTSGDCADGYECLGGECAVPGDDAGVGGGGGGGEGDAGGGGGGGDPDAGGGGGSDDGGTDAGRDGGTDAGTARDAGAACTNTSQCLAGLTCVDGVCCTTACNAACDSCNQAGNLGTCLPRPAGASVTACGLYACDGVAVTCPTSCDPDAGVNACAPAGRCEGSSCVPCWSGVTDSFSGTSSAWAFSPATAYSEAVQDGGRLVVSLQARPQAAQYAGATSAQASGLTSCGVTFELTSPPVVLGTGYVARAQLFRDTASQRPAYGWAIDQRGLVATWDLVDGGSGSQLLPLDGGAFPRWLRVQESGGQVQWRTTSGTSFSTVHAVAHDGQLDALKLRFDATFPPQGQNPVVVYSVDNLNRGP